MAREKRHRHSQGDGRAGAARVQMRWGRPKRRTIRSSPKGGKRERARVLSLREAHVCKDRRLSIRLSSKDGARHVSRTNASERLRQCAGDL